MKPSLLIAGPEFHGYTDQVYRAFLELGCKAGKVTYPKPTPILNAALTRVKRYYPAASGQRISMSLVWRRLRMELESRSYSILLLIRPDLFSKQRLKYLRDANTGAAIVGWMTDPSEKYPMSEKKIELFDKVFFYRRADAEGLTKRFLSKVGYLPMGFDDSVYSDPVVSLNSSKSLAFVGSLSGREAVIGELIRGLDLKPGQTEIYVGNRPFMSRIAGQVITKYRGGLSEMYIKRKNISAIEANGLYKSAGISLNIHRNDTDPGINPRTFEIAGAGGFQLAKMIPELESVFELDKEIVTYESTAEMLDKARFYLQNPRLWASVRQRAAIRAHRCHSFKVRMKALLNAL